MKVHEYQAKFLLAQYGVKIPRGITLSDKKHLPDVLQTIPNYTDHVVKAQIHAGGRGKGGGVKIAHSLSELEENVSSILGMQLVTLQTSKKGQRVNKVLIEEALNIKREFYFSILVDRSIKQPIILASTEGGMNIEEVAAKTPEKIHKEKIDIFLGLKGYQSIHLGYALGLHKYGRHDLVKKAAALFESCYRAFIKYDASLLEINPLVLTRENDIYALDCKMSFDDNSLSRQTKIVEMQDIEEENSIELEANRCGLNFIPLKGTIGCMVNGAGLAMATMDIIQYYGSSPANFLDVGGTADEKRVAAAFNIISRDKNVKCIFVNIFGGIVRCDIIANGILNAMQKLNLKIPIVVRLEGANSEEAHKIINDSKLAKKVTIVQGLANAAQEAVNRVK